MKQIQGHQKWKDAPILNTILVGTNPLPLAKRQLSGPGVVGYLERRFNKRRLEHGSKHFIKYAKIAMDEVYAFSNWDQVFQDVFGGTLEEELRDSIQPAENDELGAQGGRGGGEGDEHKSLRLWIQKNAFKITKFALNKA